MKKLYIYALATTLALNISAQDLKKEITIDKDIVPELSEANKINVTPQVPQLEIKHNKLKYNDRAKTAEVPGSITTLEPAENVDTISISKYRGYAMLGYFPVYNLDLTAGYTFFDNDTTKLNAWVQYNGESYCAKPRSGEDWSIYDHSVTVDVELAQRIDATSKLDFDVDYTFTNFNSPWLKKDYCQSANDFNFEALWASSVGGLKYKALASYNYFGFSDDFPYNMKLYRNIGSAFDAVKEHNVNINGYAAFDIDNNTSANLDLRFALTHDNHLLIPGWGMTNGVVWHGFRNNEGYTHSILSVTPHYDIVVDNLSLRIGANIEGQFDYDGGIYFSPDVYVDWTPTNYISAYAYFTGGIAQNTMSSIFDVSHYFMPAMAYGNSYLPCAIDAGVNLGPFKDAKIKVYGGYAFANDWLMPVFIDENYHIMNEVDLRGWHLGVEASYCYKNWGKIKASYTLAPQQDYDKGYYLWHDRAKHVVDASIIVTPIAPLDVTLGYEYRGGRSSYMQYVTKVSPDVVSPEYTRYSLGHVNNLSIGGLYRFNDQLNFFVKIENLFNHKYDLLYDIPSQGITGLLGATYKF